MCVESQAMGKHVEGSLMGLCGSWQVQRQCVHAAAVAEQDGAVRGRGPLLADGPAAIAVGTVHCRHAALVRDDRPQPSQPVGALSEPSMLGQTGLSPYAVLTQLTSFAMRMGSGLAASFDRNHGLLCTCGFSGPTLQQACGQFCGVARTADI